MSAPSSTEKTYERLVRKLTFSLVLCFNILILLDFPTFVPFVKEVP